jgi:surfactin synthase thioesterase subunit
VTAIDDKLAKLSPERRRLFDRVRVKAARPGAGDRIVPMREGSDGTTLVLMNPSGGGLFSYMPLVRTLPGGPAVVGALSLAEDRDIPVDERAGGVAARILDELAARVNLDRCVLAGWSYGGLLAFEAARRLAQRGPERPALLVDSQYAVTRGLPLPHEDELRHQFLLDVSRIEGVAPEEFAWDLPSGEVERRYAVFAGAAEAMYRYHPPTPYAGPVVVLQAEDHEARVAEWRGKSAGSFRHVVLDGGHYDVFGERNLPAVTAAVLEALASG